MTMTMSHVSMTSHDDYGKVVHRPCNSYISSVQELNKNPIEFSLSTWIKSRIKCSLLSLTYYLHWLYNINIPVYILPGYYYFLW